MNINDLKDGYDNVSSEYANRIYNELNGKPLDQELLKIFFKESISLFCEKPFLIVIKNIQHKNIFISFSTKPN